MSNGDTTATLFELAITAEKAAEEFYSGLVKKFSHVPEVSEFWEGMMKDEIQHAEALENIRGSLTSDQLLLPADPTVLLEAKGILNLSVEEKLKSVKTLEDAYQIAHELEYSEVNTVYAFLLTKFISSKKKKNFALSMLKDHLTKINEFSQNFGDAESRKLVVAKRFTS